MTLFGTLQDGQPVEAIEIGSDVLTLRLMTLGAIIQDVRFEGVDHSLTLGSDDLRDYEGDLKFFGALVGPVANRIAGATAKVDGKTQHFAADADGGHTLHGGPTGTHAQVWTIEDQSADSVTLSLDLADGLGGFPGNRRITARYTVREATFRLELTATTDAATLINLANHSFWHMHDRPSWAGHSLRIAADRYLPVDDTILPTGDISEVSGTVYDFREGQVPAPDAPPLDTCFCLSNQSEPMRDVLWLTGADGLQMTLATTAPGLQVYDQRAPALPGRATYEGLAIEPQYWPDAPNRPDFPSIALNPGDTWSQTSEWRFEQT